MGTTLEGDHTDHGPAIVLGTETLEGIHRDGGDLLRQGTRKYR